MVRCLPRSAVMVAAFLSVLSTHAQEQWSVQQYTSQDGMPQNSVITLALDDRGYAWLATEAGLARFDGSQVRPIPLPLHKGQRTDRLREIIPLGDGQFAIRSVEDRHFLLDKGTITYAGGSFDDRGKAFYFRGGMPSSELFIKLVDRASPLARFTLDDLFAVDLFDLGGKSWGIGRGSSFDVYEDVDLVRRIPLPKLHGAMFILGDAVFGLDVEGQPFRVDPVRGTWWYVDWSGPRPGRPDSTVMVSDVFWSQGMRPCWVTGEVVHVLGRNETGSLLHAERLPVKLPSGCVIRSVVYDEARGILLVGTDSKGLFVYRRLPMRNMLCPEDLRYSAAYYPQVVLDDGRLIAARAGRMDVFSADGCITDPRLPSDWGARILAMTQDRQGRVWYGYGNSLCWLDPRTGAHTCINQEGTVLEERNSYIFARAVFSLFPEGDSLWVCNGSALGYVKDDSLHLYQAWKERGPTKLPGCVRRGPDGWLWVAMCNGAFRVGAPGAGLEPVAGTEGMCVRSLEIVGDRLFLGTYGDGGFMYKDGKLRRLPQDQQGRLGHVHAFMPDAKGHLWVSTNQGLFRILLKDLDAYFADTTRSVYFGFYGQHAGIPNPEFNGGCDPPYVRLTNGFASFPNMEGLIWFQPEKVLDPFPSMPILLDGLEVDGVDHMATDVLDLPNDHQRLTVRFALSYWGDPQNAQLEYRLDAAGKGWSPLLTGQREVVLERLPPGSHELRIRKVGGDVRNDAGDLLLRLHVAYPFYFTWWFVSLAVLALFLLVYVAVRVNDSRLRERNLELARSVEARTQDLEHANVKLQRSMEVKDRLISIISHDIVMPLRYISRVARNVTHSEVGLSPEEVNGNVGDISLAADKLYANARNLLSWIKHQEGRIELRPQHVALNPFIEEILDLVREPATKQGERLVNDVPLDDIVRTDRDILGIVVQNLVSNAINHARSGEVIVSGGQQGGVYHLSVADKGRGLPAEALERIREIQTGVKKRPERLGEDEVPGLGYVIITELVLVLGGRLMVESSSKGARITIMLPMEDRTRGKEAAQVPAAAL